MQPIQRQRDKQSQREQMFRREAERRAPKLTEAEYKRIMMAVSQKGMLK